jgi:glycosyltransferase involved in cell wall biosynthesis
MISATFYRAKAALGRRMEALAGELGLDRHVNFVGAQTSGQLVRHIHESSLLVLPSRAESFGCVLVEALACGRPVVATRCGGPEDIVDDDVGRLVEPEDPRLLAAAMLEVLARRESFEPSRLRAYALDRFSCERVGERMGRAYEEVLEARAASG